MNSIIRGKARPSYKRCAFIGCRPQKMPFGTDESDLRCVEFKTRLHGTIEVLIGQGYAHFLSGGSMGMEMYAAEAVLELKEKYPWIMLEMVSPYDGQTDKWELKYQERHTRLSAAADVVTATGREYTKGSMLRRNRYLVENADLVLATYDGQSGGTAMAVQYAGDMGIPVLNLMPGQRAA